MPEVCGSAALFVDPRDPKNIAAKINQLLDDAALYQQKSTEGLAWAAQYTWQQSAQKIMKAIFDCVDLTTT